MYDALGTPERYESESRDFDLIPRVNDGVGRNGGPSKGNEAYDEERYAFTSRTSRNKDSGPSI